MEHWIADVIGKMHIHKITTTALAEHMGMSRCHISRVLNGSITPEGTDKKITAAVDEMIAARA